MVRSAEGERCRRRWPQWSASAVARFGQDGVPGPGVVIADDHAIFREGLRKLLEADAGLVVVGEAANGAEAVGLTRTLAPDLLLLDVAMPGMTGLDTLRELEGGADGVRTILLTAAIDRRASATAPQLGAQGILLREAASQLLFECIRSVMDGRYWVGRGSVTDLTATLRELLEEPAALPPQAKFNLTPRELEVVGEVVSGYSNKEIAARLKLSENTVKHHVSSIFDKTGVSTRLELVLFAVHHGVVGTEDRGWFPVPGSQFPVQSNA